MGNEPGKPADQKPDLNTAIFQLKMSAKRFARESKKAEKEKDKNLKKVEAALKKGDEESARLFAQSAQMNINDAKKFLRMSSRLESIAGQIKSNHRVSEIMGVVSTQINPILIQQVDNVDVKDLMKGFQVFQENFDKLNVNANVISDGFDRMPAENTQETADELFNQMKNKFQANAMTDQPQVIQNKQPAQTQKNDDFEKYLNDLKG